jgi:hypothetical protein
LVLSLFRNEPGVASRIAQLSPVFAFTFLPSFSAVPFADAVMFDSASSSVTISLWARTRRALNAHVITRGCDFARQEIGLLHRNWSTWARSRL